MKLRPHLQRLLAIALVGASVIGLSQTAVADDRALIDTLAANGTITQQQADDLRRSSATLVTPNRGTISELKIRGRIQGQFAHSEGPNSNTGADTGDYNTFELRRTRLGVQGRIYDHWKFLVEANVLTDTDLDSAVITYAAIPEANVTFGKAKPQFGHEENTSSASILTMERSRLTGLFNGGKPLGLRVHGRAGLFVYYAGVYNGQTVSTGRMASDVDTFLWNASGEIRLDDMIGEGVRTRFRLDYLHSDGATGYYRFEDAVAVSGHFGTGEFDLRTEYMWGERHNSDKVRGFYVMPSVYLIPKTFQMVARYESVKGDAGVNLGANRYADRIPGSYRAGNKHEALYLGGNYYIHGDNLKLMVGVERATSRDGSGASDQKGRSTTFITGVRMQF